jgi:hypothetical protein
MSSISLSNNAGGNVILSAISSGGSVVLTLPTGTANLLSNTIPAGNTTVAALTFTSGTNLSTAAPGSIEYDGKVFYGTAQSTERGVLPTQQLYYLNTGITGGNDTTTRSIFGVGVTLSASTVYLMEGSIYFTRAAGTASHTINFSFGGTATLNNIFYQCAVGKPTSPAAYDTGGNQAIANVVTAAAIINAITTQNSVGVVMRGIVNINAGGTLIPQYACSSAPGGAYTVTNGSFISFTPVGSSGNISVGPWA